MKRIILILIILFLISIGSYFFVRNLPVTEERRVCQTLIQAGRAIRERNLPKLLLFISVDYTDELGNGKGTLPFFLNSLFNEYPDLYFYTSGLKIEVEKEEAKATFMVTVLSRQKGEPIRRMIKEKIRALIKLRKEGRFWKIIRAEEAPYTFE